MRLDDWQARLHEYIAKASEAEFEYGVADCCLFAAGAVEAITGEDPAAGFRHAYSTELGGLRALKRAGYDSPEAFLIASFDEVPPAFAGAGDVCLMSDGAVGVSVGDRIALIAEDGVVFTHDPARRAFRVGG